MSITKQIDYKIANFLVTYLLSKGCRLTVNDGEKNVLVKSRDLKKIMGSLNTTDATRLMIWRNSERLGSVLLIFGNDGYDLISDFAGPTYYYDTLSKLVVPTMLYANHLSRKDASVFN